MMLMTTKPFHRSPAAGLCLVLSAMFLIGLGYTAFGQNTADAAATEDDPGQDGSSTETRQVKKQWDPTQPYLEVLQVVEGDPQLRYHPEALPTLLQHLNEFTALNVRPEPLFIESFEDPVIFRHPLIYVNFADRTDWSLSSLEVDNLKKFLERGGFIYIDAGINSEFLSGQASYGQFHSFADWSVSPPIQEAFQQVFPENEFEPLPRSHEIFSAIYAGLPDPEVLPDTVREFVVEEKWPQGTYSFMALMINGHPGVVASPVVSMGWGEDRQGNWSSTISFRIRATSEGLSERLEAAATPGTSFSATREDGREETIYTQEQAIPAWVQEPDGGYRMFAYYSSREISDYAHVFFTRLGINVFVYALSH